MEERGKNEKRKNEMQFFLNLIMKNHVQKHENVSADCGGKAKIAPTCTDFTPGIRKKYFCLYMKFLSKWYPGNKHFLEMEEL